MDSIKTVKTMQDFIKRHFKDEEFNIDMVSAAVGYSKRHANRLFKQYIGMTLQEYINSVYLTESANELVSTKNSILEIALNSNYKSHEGFTRSFNKRFNVTPIKYRESQIPISLFVQYPINHYYALLKNKEENAMNDDLNLCMVTAKERPKRKLIYLPSHNAKDYFSYCEEMGCEWEGLLNSINEKFDMAALIELPDFLVEKGFSKTAAGVEVSADYDKPLPKQYLTADLEECIMLYFQSEPYESEEDFCKAIENTYAAINKYNAEIYGYKLAYDIAPCFNFGADTSTGAKLAVPALNK